MAGLFILAWSLSTPTTLRYEMMMRREPSASRDGGQTRLLAAQARWLSYF